MNAITSHEALLLICQFESAQMSRNTVPLLLPNGTADLGVKIEKIPGVIKGRFYMTTSLSDSWEAFTPLHAGVTLGRFLHQLVVAFFSPTSIESIIYNYIKNFA